MDGSCVDIVRVRDRGSTLFEFCGTAAGTRIVSNSNVLTLDFVASRRLYSARGFLLQYQGKREEISNRSFPKRRYKMSQKHVLLCNKSRIILRKICTFFIILCLTKKTGLYEIHLRYYSDEISILMPLNSPKF